MNAWIWRWIVVGSLALAVLWCVYWWPRSAWVAVAGLIWLGGATGLQLGVQMLLMRWVGRHRGLRAPSWATMGRAWLAEWRLALQVFGWRQPFRTEAQADDLQAGGVPQVGMVLVHGYFCNRAFWAPWLRELQRQGIACAAVTLEPAQGAGMDAMVADLDACVRRMARATGRAPLLVAHSMGGLVVRAWLKTLLPGERRSLAAHVVTVATPHQGTWLARFAWRQPVRDMREGCDWLAALGPPPGEVPFTCWSSRCDNVVFPATLAALPGCELRQVDDAAHLQLLFDERVWRYCLQLRGQLEQGCGYTPAVGSAAGCA